MTFDDRHLPPQSTTTIHYPVLLSEGIASHTCADISRRPTTLSRSLPDETMQNNNLHHLMLAQLTMIGQLPTPTIHQMPPLMQHQQHPSRIQYGCRAGVYSATGHQGNCHSAPVWDVPRGERGGKNFYLFFPSNLYLFFSSQ